MKADFKAFRSMLTWPYKCTHRMGFTCYCINLRIVDSFFLGSRLVVYLAQVSAFAKIMKHDIMIDQFEEENIA